jgi:superfamily II DNA or RNA helicase
MVYERRQYQEDAISLCLDALAEKGSESVLLESPVGSGKTYMALEMLHRLQGKLGRQLKINWVAPRHRLLQQVMAANRDLYGDNIRPVSLFARTPPEADFVVLDEAHHEATQSCVLLYEKMRAKMTLGLSATPLRTDRMKLSFQKTVRTCSIARLIREGYLSQFNSYLIPTYSVETVAEHYLASPEKWGKSLVFFDTIAQCVQFKALMEAGGVAVEVVTGESNKDAQMEAFESGRVRVVANVAMLTEGFDQPDLMSIFARDSSRLPAIQMCGRGLRKAPGKDACNIVQSGTSKYLFERVAKPKNAFRWQQGRWLALSDGTEEIEYTLKETLRLIEERQKKDKESRRGEYRRARRAVTGKFQRSIERIDAAREQERRFYSRFKCIYTAFADFYREANSLCWGGTLPDCALHLSKALDSSRTVAMAIRNFGRDGDDPFPAIAIRLTNCMRNHDATISPRRLGVEVLREMIRLRRIIAGEAPNASFWQEFIELGFDEVKSTYRRGTPFEGVISAADAHFGPVMGRFRPALTDPFSGTMKGDVRIFLESRRPAA